MILVTYKRDIFLWAMASFYAQNSFLEQNLLNKIFFCNFASP